MHRASRTIAEMLRRVDRRRRSLNSPKQRPRPTAFETLEPRHMLYGGLVINELMAVNNATLADEDGEFSDWLELKNVSSAPVNLDGYYLTDDADDLDQWRVPNVSLAAGDLLTIFASQKDRDDPSEQLHTNFKLSGNGEFLALVAPDQTTIVDAFNPFPEQLTDVSYGVLNHLSTSDQLVGEGSPLRLLVPTDGSLGLNWTANNFDDSSWLDTSSGIGYDTQTSDVLFALIDIGLSTGRAEATGVAEGQIGSSSTTADLPATSLTSTLQTGSTPFTIAIDTGGLGGSIDWRDRGDSSLSEALTFLGEDQVKNNAGHLTVTLGALPAGVYQVTSYHSDGQHSQSEAIRIFVDEVEQQGVIGHANFDIGINNLTTAAVEATSASFSVSANGVDDVVIRFDGSQAADTEVPLSGIKLEHLGELYAGVISEDPNSDLQSSMFGQSTSAYARIPFEVATPEDYDSLTLHIAYEDGFDAYLNGTKIASRNAPANPTFNSTAISDRPDDDALTEELIDVSGFLDALQAGTNLLAIHGLNDEVASPRFLLASRLTGEKILPGRNEYFTTPTPGNENVPGALGRVGDTSFSVDRGFYDAPLQVEITTSTAGAEIRYTLDGTEPSATTGSIYTDPIDILTTTTLRAAAYLPGYLSTNVDTHTYIFLADVLQQTGAGLPTNWGHAGPDYDVDPDIVNDPAYSATIQDDLKSIPTISLVMDEDDWFGTDGQGIYIQGTGSERAVSTELIQGDGSAGFQINAAVQIQGGSSTNRWKNDKLSMRLKFKEPYGPTKLDFPLFGADAETKFDTIILDAVLNYSWLHNFSESQRDNAKYIQDQFMADLQNEMGGAAPHASYSHLYINGLYWGMYYVHERPDESFAAHYLGGNKDDYDVIKHGSGTVVNGSNANYVALLAAVNQDLADPVNYQAVADLLDIDEFIDYMLLNIYGGNTDWAHHNWYASYNRVDPDGRWRFHSWDAEHVLTSLSTDVTNKNDTTGPTRIHQQLRLNSDYELLFADHVQRHLFGDGILTPGNAQSLYEQRMNEVERALVGESARWGDNRVTVPFTQADWAATQAGLLASYFPSRTGVVLEQLRDDDLYTALDAPSYNQQGGTVLPGFEATINAPQGTIYYTDNGSDPRLSNGDLSPDAQVYQSGEINTTLIGAGADWRFLDDGTDQSSSWRATSFDDDSWDSGPAQLGYGDGDETTTVSYGGDGQAKFLTTYFRHTFDLVDPSSFDQLTLQLLRDDGAVVYLNGEELFRPNMPAGAINHLTPAFSTVGGAAESAWTSYDIDPSKLLAGENVVAVEVHQISQTSSDISFDLDLVAREFVSDTPIVIDQSTLLRTRTQNAGSWSAVNEALFLVNPAGEGNLAITEVNYNPHDALLAFGELDVDNDEFEFIELQNISGADIDLTGVQLVESLVDTDVEGVVFTFPIATLSPGEYVLVVEDLLAFQSRYGTGLNVVGEWSGELSNGGEQLTLLAADDALIQQFSYYDSNSWPGRADGNASSLEVYDVHGDYAAADNWHSSVDFGGSPGTIGRVPDQRIVINEVLAHTDVPEVDSVELFNTSGSDVDISHWYLSDNNSNYLKYSITDPTSIATNTYRVFDETDFNPGAGVNPNDFSLSSFGDDVWLIAADPTTEKPTHFVDRVEFQATLNGISVGRLPNGDPNASFVPMAQPTLGEANAAHRVGELIISEVHYNPAGPDAGLEFLEIYNTTTAPIDLKHWRINNAVDFDLPAGVMIASESTAVLVGFDPLVDTVTASTFRTTYGIDESVLLVGPWQVTDALNDGGETIDLELRNDELEAGETKYQYILIDRVDYDNITPWPTTPDGLDDSLQRDAPDAYGNDASNWFADLPTPGTGFLNVPAVAPLDFNEDGTVDASTDGNQVLVVLFGLPDANLTPFRGNTSLTNTEIGANVQQLKDNLVLDVNADGTVDASTDGNLILAVLFGLPSSNLSSFRGSTSLTNEQIQQNVIDLTVLPSPSGADVDPPAVTLDSVDGILLEFDSTQQVRTMEGAELARDEKEPSSLATSERATSSENPVLPPDAQAEIDSVIDELATDLSSQWSDDLDEWWWEDEMLDDVDHV